MRAALARCAVLGVGVLALSGCGRFLGPRATLGPGAIVRGRGLYNEVINETNNQQTLDLIVHARYGEPSSMLSVGSVTANLRAGTTSEAQFGIGPDSNFKGNIGASSARSSACRSPIPSRRSSTRIRAASAARS